MTQIFIQSTEGKANLKDGSIIKKHTNINFNFDTTFKTGWVANIENSKDGELLAMKLKFAGLSKKYFLRIKNQTENNTINLF